jgi:hypothetical protein
MSHLTTSDSAQDLPLQEYPGKSHKGIECLAQSSSRSARSRGRRVRVCRLDCGRHCLMATTNVVMVSKIERRSSTHTHPTVQLAYLKRQTCSEGKRVKFAVEQAKREWTYSSTLSLTSALDEGRWSTTNAGRFTLRKDPVPIVYEAGWAPGTVWTSAENIARTGIRSPDRPARS